MSHPIVLTVAGSDSGGGAGIQADLKTFAAHGCYGMSVITALTAQNTLGVTMVQDAAPEMVRAQLEAVLSDIGCVAAKTGMLSRPDTMMEVVAAIDKFSLRTLVVDPVMVAKGGAKLLADEAIDALKRELLPRAMLITPNLEEVEVLSGARPTNVDEMAEAARALSDLGPKAVLIKGGHLTDSNRSDDILWDGWEIHQFPAPRLDQAHTHGTGCTLSAAITANLAKGHSLHEAVAAAKAWLGGAMRHAWPLGGGIGPVDHLWRWHGEDSRRTSRG